MNTYYFYYLILFTLLISYIIQRLIGYYKKSNAKNDRDDLNEIAKTGGLIEFIRQKHAKYGDIVEFYMGKNNHVVSIIEPNLIKATMKLGSRPKYLFHFLAPLLGEDNLQIFSAERASQFRKLVSNCLDSQSNSIKLFKKFKKKTQQHVFNNFKLPTTSNQSKIRYNNEYCK